MTGFHIVVSPNETLSQISRNYGVPMSVLRNINAIGNENRLPIGQKIYLREEDVLGVQVLLLDTDRNPIKDQKYVLEFACRVHEGMTDCGGLTKQIYTGRPTDRVRILIERLDGSLKEVATVDSGYRNKLVTVLSPRYRADSKTELDTVSDRGEPIVAPETGTPIYKRNQRQPATTGKKELGPQIARTSTASQRPLTEVKGDIPELDLFLDKYDGCDLSDDDIATAAKDLECEPGLIHAIAKQESSTSSFFKIGDRRVPKILFERHAFRRQAKSDGDDVASYHRKYPDICGPAYRRANRNRKNQPIDPESGRVLSLNDVYGAGGFEQYKRLLKAYQLNPDAALCACSWGKFQIMGYNYSIAGFDDVRSFVRAMSRSEAEHMKAFLKFAKNKKVLRTGLQRKDFNMIAEGHNGSNWQSVNPEYATNLKKFYEAYTHAHAKST